MTGKNKIIIGIVAVILILTGVFFYVSLNKTSLGIIGINKSANYAIPGVPFGGLFNHKAVFSLAGGDTSTAMASIMEYWNPGQNNIIETKNCFRLPNGNLITGDVLGKCFQKFGQYKFEEVKLETGDLKKYINSEVKTPLMLFYPLTVDQPENITYHPAWVLIGVNEIDKKVTLHSYWFGNNYEISFADFEKGWQSMRPDERKKYFVVQPADLNGKLKEISSRAVSSYPARTQTMDNSLAILKNLALAYGASITNLYDTALPYYEKIKDQPNFDQLPVYIKVDYYYEMADAYSKLGKYDQAIDNANKAIALDTNFDQPSGDWPGYDVTANKPDIKGQISGPYRILGDVYFAQGNFKSAGENYGKALDIAPGNQLAIFGLKLTKLELAKSK